MKLFLSALLLLFVFKGVFYIFFPKYVHTFAAKLMDCPTAQLVGFGWILVLVSAAAWLSFVRYLP